MNAVTVTFFTGEELHLLRTEHVDFNNFIGSSKC